ncbi:Rossmann-like and DUF2520 domain-containing protein [Xylanibacter muris]|uniref:DUF2520 domain-containing protein n=1 Tax=Xylanibacter muris TaxID=2736290 RepID=A0ABX2AMI1_9BACT|nr:Rossmann-like and DUF2520 domain-containing protein [Xylanibacter muris]NPD91439.1 DUF2520 domain-containing protein [Xylanibacter muris]
MKIVLIGAGKLAMNVGRALLGAGHDIVQVYSRTMESALRVAAVAGGAPTTDISSLSTNADVYIVALKDSVLADIIPLACRGRERKIFLHTAGSVPMDIFKGMALHYGVFYPMQTFSLEREADFSRIPFFIEGNDELTRNAATELASSLSEKVVMLSSEQRKHLHLAAVFASNFVNHCYTIASDILARQGVPFDVMLSLIDETAGKVHDMSPADAQTGPAVRYDENVMRSHGLMLRDNPLFKDIYDRMSLSIHKRSIKKK